MSKPLAIRADLHSAGELRVLARRTADRRAATRMLAIAHAMEGKSRAEAARLVGLERQALRDAVTRYNAEGVVGLWDRPKSGRPPTLTEGEQATLRAVILRGVETDDGGGGEWTLPMLCRWIEGNFGKRLHPASLSRVVRRLDLSRQKTRAQHPLADEKAQAAFKKRGSARHWQ
jgi:transposase